MSETGFQIFNRAFPVTVELIYAVLITAFFHPFMSGQGRELPKRLIVFSVYILFELICNQAAIPRGPFGLILTVLLLAVSKWIGLGKSLVFLLTLLYFNARISGGLIVQSVYFLVEQLLPLRIEPPEAVFHYPESGAYDAFDVGIILQNLLQNALEACEKANEGKRFIMLTGKRKGRFFLIEVKNSFIGEVVFGQNGLPPTTKKDAPMHGIGLSNVRREAEKYMGELELKADRQEFFATVLLQERGN